MTICVSVKTRQGLVLGTDSMTTIGQSVGGQIQVVKTYSNARKLTQIGQLPIGVFTYGVGNVGARSIYGLITEFCRNVHAPETVLEIAERLSAFIQPEYQQHYGNDSEEYKLGLYVAGYSPESALPEEWSIEFPNAAKPELVQPNDSFNVNWRAITLPFMRLHQGFDIRFYEKLAEKMLNIGISEQVMKNIFNMFKEAMEEIPLTPSIQFASMPIQNAINFAVYVLQTTIGYTTFESVTPSCGGPLQIAVISEDRGFVWVREPQYRILEGANDWS